MKIAICDDDQQELKNIKSIIQKFIDLPNQANPITVHTFPSGPDLLLFIQKFGGFDLLILDIIMPGLNGIELAQKIRSQNENCRIIFLTFSPDFAIESYKVNAFYYLLKSHMNAEIHALLQKASDEICKENTCSVLIKEKGKLTRVRLHTIQYLESVNHTVYFHLQNNEVLSCYSTMNEFLDILLANKRFIKCHKSFIVNMSYVTSISNKNFVLDGEIKLPISRDVFQQVRKAYFDYFFLVKVRRSL